MLSVELGAVLNEWAWLLDHGRHAELARLFTSDAELIGPGGVLRGRKQIEQRYASRTAVRTTRHVGSGLRVVEAAGGRAHTTSVWVCYASNLPAPVEEAQVYQVADVHTAFVRADHTWLIASHQIVPVLRDPVRAPVSA